MSPRSRVVLQAAPAALFAIAATTLAALVLRRASAVGETLLIAFSLVGYARMALSAWASVLGLVPRRRRALAAEWIAPARTALLLPVYNEPPDVVAASVAVMAASLKPADGVSIFVLSDSQDPSVIAREDAVFARETVTPSGVVVRYRRRARNVGRKAGNLTEFCQEAGPAFDHAIILDADSLMTGAAIRQLTRALQASPGAGLVQSVSYPVGSGTLFGRMQQFAARLSTTLNVAGQDLWQGRQGTYWGHNAIVRLAPFCAHARLPVLRGRPPLGGEVLCHDTIEAALLLRAGWDVELAPAIEGSYETTPSNLLDHLARERRWCQGNLQHLRLIGAPGFVWASRLHILIGILHYLAAPAGLGLSGLLLFSRGTAGSAPPAAVLALTWLTLMLLFGPKLLSIGRALVSGRSARGFGGRARLLASALIEQVFSTVTAPILLVSVTGFVLSTAAGRVVAWEAAARGDRALGWREAWCRLWPHTLIGAAAAGAMLVWRGDAVVWLAPFLTGLVGAVPIAVWSSSIRLGWLARRAGLFWTEDEVMPTAELAGVGRQVERERVVAAAE